MTHLPPRVARLRLTLPLPPSFNEAWVPFAFMNKGKPAARIILSKSARKWQEAAAELLAQVRKVPALASPSAVLEVELVVYVPSVSSDGTNRVKLVEDSLAKAGLIHNDRGNVDVRVVKRIDAKAPRVEVEVREARREEHAEVARRLETSEREARRREARQAAGSLFEESVTLTTSAAEPKYRTPAPVNPSAPTYGKRHGLDKLVRGRRLSADLAALATPASYPSGRAPK